MRMGVSPCAPPAERFKPEPGDMVPTNEPGRRRYRGPGVGALPDRGIVIGITRVGSAMARPFYTIGHSTRPLDEFVALLRDCDVRLVADVRTVPRSRTNPQYNRDTLPEALAPYQIGYEHIAALGGLRGHKRDMPPEVNGFWQNGSFHN